MFDESPSFEKLFLPFTNKKAILWIIIIGFIVYANAMFNPFIADDQSQIVENPIIHSIINFPYFFTGGSFNAGGGAAGIYYKPLFSLMLSIIFTLFGPSPFFFHTAQLSLHIINAILVFFLCKKFLKRHFAFFLSLIFLIHPINSESVIYISGMQEPLFFFFGIIGLFLLMRNRITILSFFFTSVCLFLSLLSKETGILFVLIAIVYALLFKRNLLKYCIVFFALTVGVYLFLRIVIGGIYFNREVLSPMMQASFFERIISFPSFFFYYIKTFFFPYSALFSQQWVVKQINFTSFIAPLLIDLFFLSVLFAIGAVLKKHSKKSIKIFLFFSLWFLFGIIFHSQLFPLDTTVSDRWFYFSIIGLLGVLGVGYEYLIDAGPGIKKTIIAIIAITIISLLSIRTTVRNTNWSSPIVLYSHDILLMPPNFSLENSLSYEYLKEMKLPQAFAHAKKSVGLFPTFLNLTNLGAVYTQMGDINKGRTYFLKALQKGDFYLTYQNLAGISAFYDQPGEAKKDILKYIKRFPGNSKLYIYLSVAFYRGGDSKNAKIYAQKACQLSYDSECLYLLNQIENRLPIEGK